LAAARAAGVEHGGSSGGDQLKRVARLADGEEGVALGVLPGVQPVPEIADQLLEE